MLNLYVGAVSIPVLRDSYSGDPRDKMCFEAILINDQGLTLILSNMGRNKRSLLPYDLSQFDKERVCSNILRSMLWDKVFVSCNSGYLFSMRVTATPLCIEHKVSSSGRRPIPLIRAVQPSANYSLCGAGRLIPAGQNALVRRFPDL